jgi:CRP-like cAMP-binding protein
MKLLPNVCPDVLMVNAHRNLILNGLPARESRLLMPHLKPITLAKDAVLYEAGQRIKQVYFPEEAMISCLSGTADGESIEVCVVGHEGVVGITSLFENVTAFQAVVQIPGRAYAVNCEFLQTEFGRCDVVHRVLLRYTNAVLLQLSQTAVCNKFHSVEERFCRWLLTAQDKVSVDSIPMTHDALARVLGTRRASISGTAAAFQRSGAIRYERGTIFILDRRKLEEDTCECYEAIAAAHEPSSSPRRPVSV